MKHISYPTQGTCCKLIDLTVDDNDRVDEVRFLGGCNGNLQGIAHLIKGMAVDDVIKRLRGIRCGAKATSCPDQLSRALEEVKKQ